MLFCVLCKSMTKYCSGIYKNWFACVCVCECACNVHASTSVCLYVHVCEHS